MALKIPSKKFLLSQLLLLILGLGAIGGINLYLDHKSHPKNLLEAVQKGTPLKPISYSFDVSLPEDNMLVFSDTINITGTTNPGGFVLISSGGDDLVIKAKDDGTFTTPF